MLERFKKFFRTFIRDRLARYFLLLKVPDSFQKVASNCKKTIVITQSDSIVVEALLKSFAQRREITTIVRLNCITDDTQLSSDEYILFWESLHSENSIERIKELFPNADISTFNIFAGRGPIYTNPNYKIKKRTLFTLLLTPLMGLFGRHFLLFVFGEPFPIQSQGISNKTRLSRRIKVNIYQNTKLVRGVAFQQLDVQERYILEGQEAQRIIKLLTKKLNKSEDKIKLAMRKEFRKMAANASGTYLAIAGAISRRIIKRFPEVVTIGLDNFKNAIKGNPVVLIPMHRSHFDYILLSGMLYNLDLRTPLVASGMNLNFWPIGSLLAKTGAFYIRREGQNHIHNFILQRYITYLIKRGHLQEFFIEGGRSRSGRMLPPKLGLLGIMINAFLKGVRKEIIFLPVSFSYEHVSEVENYARENTGQPKKSENCIALLKATKRFIITPKHGEVIINFGEPLSLAEFTANICKDDKTNEAFKKRAVSGMGTLIMDRIAEQISPCLSNLTYTALMMAPHYCLKRYDLIQTIKNLAKLIEYIRPLNPNLGENSPALKRFLANSTHDLNELIADDSIRIHHTNEEEIYFVPGNRRYTADFYKNSTLHIFYTISLMSILELQTKSITVENIEEIYSLLGQRNIILRQNDIRQEASLFIQCLQNADILSKDDIVHFKDKSMGIFIPSLLLTNFESLACVYKNMIVNGQECNTEITEDGTQNRFNYANFIKQAQASLIHDKLLNSHIRTESSAKSALGIAIESSKQNNIISMDSLMQAKTFTLLHKPEDELKQIKAIINLIRNYLYVEN